MTKRKLTIFDACILSKLMYGLSSAVLTKVDRKRLDAFHAGCTRKIIRVAPAYHSRVSNHTVFERARTKPASRLLLKPQLSYFGRLALKDQSDPMRRCIFENDSLEPRKLLSKRRVARPRLEWSTEIRKHALQMMGGEASLKAALQPNSRLSKWNHQVYAYVDIM